LKVRFYKDMQRSYESPCSWAEMTDIEALANG